MGIARQRRRGTTLQHATFHGLEGELTVDITKHTVVVHNGVTDGGFPLALENHSHSNASNVAAGFMSAADKTKLDVLPTGIYNQHVQANTVPSTQRGSINFTTAFVVTDDNAGDRTHIDLATAASPGTYTKVTVNNKGIVTTGADLQAGDIPTLTAAKISDFNTTVRANRIDQLGAPQASVSFGGNKITSLGEPQNDTDAATKAYADSIASGLTFKQPVRAATTGSIDLNNPGSSIDGVVLSASDRILVKSQSTQSDNGIYVWNGAAVSMTRATDANTSAEMAPGSFMYVSEGNTNGDVAFVLQTNAPINLGTTPLSFVQFSSVASITAGNGLQKVGNQISVKTINANRIYVDANGVDLGQTGVSGGTYNSVTVDIYGRVTSASSISNQPLADNLTAVAGVSSNGFFAKTDTNTAAARTITAGTGIAVSNGDGVSGNPQVSVTADTTIQRVSISKSGTVAGSRKQVNFIPGAGVAITTADNSGNNRVDVTVATDGSQALNSSEFITVSSDASLYNGRKLVAGPGIELVDSGPGGTLTIALNIDFGDFGGPTNFGYAHDVAGVEATETSHYDVVKAGTDTISVPADADAVIALDVIMPEGGPAADTVGVGASEGTPTIHTSVLSTDTASTETNEGAPGIVTS